MFFSVFSTTKTSIVLTRVSVDDVNGPLSRGNVVESAFETCERGSERDRVAAAPSEVTPQDRLCVGDAADLAHSGRRGCLKKGIVAGGQATAR